MRVPADNHTAVVRYIQVYQTFFRFEVGWVPERGSLAMYVGKSALDFIKSCFLHKTQNFQAIREVQYFYCSNLLIFFSRWAHSQRTPGLHLDVEVWRRASLALR